MSLQAAETEKTRSRRHLQKFEGHATYVFDVIHLPGGQRIITCSNDGSLRVWNLESGEQIGDDWRDGESQVFTMALSPDGKKIVSGGKPGGWVRFWDIDTGKLITRWMAHTNSISSLCWSRDGGRVVTGSFDRTVRVWNVESKETILEIKIEHSEHSNWQPRAIYSPDEAMIATSAQSLKIWDAKTGNLIKILKGHERQVACLAWTADGGTLISGGFDRSIKTWNTTTWQQIHILTGHTSSVLAIAVSPNGRILASASWDHTVRLWNIDNGQPIGLPLQHADSVHCVSLSADGKLLATGCGSTDKSAYTWDISVIVREAGLNELLLNPNDGGKALLDARATRRPPETRYTCRLPSRFLDNSPYHPDSSGRRVSPPSAPPHHVTRDLSSRQGRPLGRVVSLFRRSHDNSHGIVSQSTVVDVPFVKGKRRNISGAEIRFEKEKARNVKNASASSSRPPHTIIILQSDGVDPAQSSSRPHDASVSFTTPATASAAMTSDSPQPPQSSITQQFGGAGQMQSTSQLHSAVSAPSTTPAITTTSTTALPDLTIRQAGCWIRFWLIICCASPEYSDDRH